MGCDCFFQAVQVRVVESVGEVESARNEVEGVAGVAGRWIGRGGLNECGDKDFVYRG
jgi:hypothetical protein